MIWSSMILQQNKIVEKCRRLKYMNEILTQQAFEELAREALKLEKKIKSNQKSAKSMDWKVCDSFSFTQEMKQNKTALLLCTASR